MAVASLLNSTSVQSPIRTAVAAAAARQGTGFGPMLREIARLPGTPADQVQGSPKTPFRFDDQTWLRLVQTYGAGHGLGQLAEGILTDANGAREARNPDLGQEILRLRDDPAVARVMAEHLATEHAKVLQGELGRAPTDGELYLSHLLGPDRAARFSRLQAANPAASATELFPDAARRYPALFGTEANSATLRDVQQRLSLTPVQAAKPKAELSRFTSTVAETVLSKSGAPLAAARQAIGSVGVI
ncbi:hypothetical protein [Desertibaculum subflavum]|uniref:hypothetical protein n=1 Tax=Desertibaculum subflavum TaxID=2268458 RepID=UPI000E66A2A4